ncbi:MAG TPA: VOC family protein [Abditibacteriaceae bacterium]
MESTTLSLIVIRAADMKASLAFYHALGVAFIQEQHGSGPIHYSCDFGGLVLELYPNKTSAVQESGTHTTMLGFKVSSIERTLVELSKLGIKPEAEPKESDWGRWVNVTDPGGRTVQINEVRA